MKVRPARLTAKNPASNSTQLQFVERQVDFLGSESVLHGRGSSCGAVAINSKKNAKARTT